MQEQELLAKVTSLNHLSDTKIGATLGISKDQVYRLRKKHNIKKQDTFLNIAQENGFNDYEYGWVKTDDASIFIKKENRVITYAEIRDDLCEQIKKYAPKYPKIKRRPIKNKHLLILDPADIHVGKLSKTEETGQEYNIQLAKQRCREGVQGILDKAQGFSLEKILFIIGNDILHTDNPFRKTTSGTPQDTDGQWWEIFKEAKSLYVEIIEMLVQVADVEVVYCPSNHDFMSAFMLADTLQSWFYNNKNVSFSIDIKHRKYVQYGLNMLAFDHGDGCKETDTKDLMADEAPKMWGDTKFRYSYKHHLHHKKRLRYRDGQDFIGVTVEYLRSPSSPDAWHHRNGYVAPKAIEGFVHHKEYGQVARLTHYF